MIDKESRNSVRRRRALRVRKKVVGTTERPRLCVFRSNKHIEAQLIDDSKGVTLCSCSSVQLKLANGSNIEAAGKVGEALAKKAIAAGINEVVFDRNGYLYHGRVAASETATVEPHGSASAPRPGDRKYGNHKGRPSERRGGRGGLRRNMDNYLERVVAINRIAKTTKGGKNVRFSALAVVGDDKGKYGFALSKSSEVPDAIKKALARARKQMRSVEIINGTIAHDVEGKFGATKVVLKPAPEGTGIVAGGAVRAIVELAGIKNLVAKVYGSRAPINVIRATDAGLTALMRYEKVMVLRGKKTEEEIRASRAAKAPKAKVEPEEKGENE